MKAKVSGCLVSTVPACLVSIVSARLVSTVSACVLSIVLVSGVYGGGRGADPPKGDTAGGSKKAETAPANPEKRGREAVPVSERIAMGVEEPTWIKEHGTVHPDVRRALAHQRDLENNVDKNTAAALAALDQAGPGGLGYVYVVVHLEYKHRGKCESEADKAAIRALQSSVLSELTAAEFCLWLRFPDRPAMVGCINESGLRKLAQNEKVLAIGLDDKPCPEVYTPEFYCRGPQGEGAAVPGKISAQVLAALDKANEILVWVDLRMNRCEDDRDLIRWQVAEYKKSRAVHDRVFGQLSAEEFRAIIRHWGVASTLFTGWVTKAGLAKLAEHPEVENVVLPAPPAKPGGKG